MEYARLAAAGVAWFVLHAGIAGSSLRTRAVARFGEKAYRSAFSLASIGCLWWLIYEYGHARYTPLWITPRPFYLVPAVVMPVAFVFLAGAFIAGKQSGRIFIENGRFHGEVVIKEIAQRLGKN